MFIRPDFRNTNIRAINGEPIKGNLYPYYYCNMTLMARETFPLHSYNKAHVESAVEEGGGQGIEARFRMASCRKSSLNRSI